MNEKLVVYTRFEIARLIGERTEQIDRGSPIFVSTRHKHDTSEIIAYRELLLRKIPIIIERTLQSNPPQKIKIRVSDVYFSDNFIRDIKDKIETLRQQRADVLALVFSK